MELWSGLLGAILGGLLVSIVSYSLKIYELKINYSQAKKSHRVAELKTLAIEVSEYIRRFEKVYWTAKDIEIAVSKGRDTTKEQERLRIDVDAVSAPIARLNPLFTLFASDMDGKIGELQNQQERFAESILPSSTLSIDTEIEELKRIAHDIIKNIATQVHKEMDINPNPGLQKLEGDDNAD